MKSIHTPRISAIVALILVLSSCSVIKKIRKSKEDFKQDTSVQVNESTKAKTDTDTKSKTLVTLQADTSATIKGQTHNGTISLNDLKEKDAVIIRQDGAVMSFSTDEKGKYLYWKSEEADKTIPFKFSKTTYREEDKKETKVVRSDSSAKVTTSTETSKSKVDKDVKRSAWQAWIFVLIVLVVVGYVMYRRYKQLL